jgi:hypothetical protein
VMVRDAASVLQDLVPSCGFHLVVDFKRVLHFLVVESEVNVNSGSLKDK